MRYEDLVTDPEGTAEGIFAFLEPAEHWLVRLNERTVSFVNRAAQEDSDWDIIGSAGAWEQVISDKINLSAALRVWSESTKGNTHKGILEHLPGIS